MHHLSGRPDRMIECPKRQGHGICKQELERPMAIRYAYLVVWHLFAFLATLSHVKVPRRAQIDHIHRARGQFEISCRVNQERIYLLQIRCLIRTIDRFRARCQAPFAVLDHIGTLGLSASWLA
jgi:hypothetical protein